jgi:hypothetical protein
MPHCGLGLYNNVIWANWAALHRCVIVGNSLTQYVAKLGGLTASADEAQKSASLVAAHALLCETPCPPQLLQFDLNSFNDMSVHCFRDKKKKKTTTTTTTNNGVVALAKQPAEWLGGSQDAEIISAHDEQKTQQ